MISKYHDFFNFFSRLLSGQVAFVVLVSVKNQLLIQYGLNLHTSHAKLKNIIVYSYIVYKIHTLVFEMGLYTRHTECYNDITMQVIFCRLYGFTVNS